jgi:hypothetical protein
MSSNCSTTMNETNDTSLHVDDSDVSTTLNADLTPSSNVGSNAIQTTLNDDLEAFGVVSIDRQLYSIPSIRNIANDEEGSVSYPIFGHDAAVDGDGDSIDEDEQDCREFESNRFAESTTNAKNKIAKKKTQDVHYYKYLIFTVLGVAAIGMVAFVSVFVRNSETSRFEEAFYENSKRLLDAVGGSIDNTLVPLDALSIAIVSHAKAQNDTFPFVTLPDFGLRMAKMLPLSDGMNICVLPIVQPEQRSEWELYASQNNHWVNESLHIQEKWDGYHGPINYDWLPYNTVHTDDGDLPWNIRYEN